ncbi:hypothetical protein KC19_VG119200 [Ceratodon purpureus]|uniref:tRNA(Ile)-lysidine synthetase n=1 Tax=Ceratodon purpureus TaxID=3225 RepID=A0A8T0HQ51_CERPU|nr:hypothetical protein KC19_VG119200 [Ceratodon purpureus]
MVLLSSEEDFAVGSQEPVDVSLDIPTVFASRMAAAGIQPLDRIAIAVSGGPDSMALCLLAKQWWQGFRDSGVYAEKPTGIVVDHGLRPESAAEALQVQRWVSNLGMDCHILKCEWLNGRPDSGHLQEAARNARYSLMEQTCWKHDVSTLLTGHHADDQAELFLMRLARKSGIIGLAGMAFVSHFYSRRPTSMSQTYVLLVRPLLQFSKQDLYTVCKNAGQQWVEDPSNSSRIFARNRIRQVLADPLYDDARREIHHLIAACRQTRAVLDKERDDILAKTVTLSKDFAYVAIHTDILASSSVSDAVLGRVLVAVLQFVAQREKPPRGKALKILMDKLRQPPVKEAFTLAGCHVSPAPGSKGSRVMVCLSPESPTPALGSDLISWESGPVLASKKRDLGGLNSEDAAYYNDGKKLILDARSGAPSVLEQGRKLGLVSDGVAALLELLKKEIAETMGKTIEDCKKSEPPNNQLIYGMDNPKQMLPLGHTCFFMSRFLVSWEPKAIPAKLNEVQYMTLSGDQRGRCCLLRDKPAAWVRHYEDTDFDHLQNALKISFKTKVDDKVSSWCVYRFESDLYGADEEKRQEMQLELAKSPLKRDTSRKPRPRKNPKVKPIYCGGYVTSKAQRALAILRCIPKPVLRGLPVLVSAEGLLLAIPTLDFQRCPLVSFSAVLCSRIPLGGGQSSWT